MAVGISILFAIYKSKQPQQIRIEIKTSNTIVTIWFGDLFASPGHKVIPVNEYFDSELGEYVSPKSLHGLFIKRILGGNSLVFDNLADESLATTKCEIQQRERGRIKRYPIGTTAVVTMNDEKYFLVALSKTNMQTLKASADIPQLWTALEGLWKQVRISSGDCAVSIPLIGGGLSGIGLPSTQLLQLIILSIVSETKKTRIAPEIKIILQEDLYKEVDLELIARNWR